MTDAFALIADMVKDAERHAEDMSKDRIRAIEYYRGEMTDVVADNGRSSMTVREVRARIKKVLPSLMRTILGGDQVVEYPPMGEGDEEGAAQATDYINAVVIGESGARRAIEDAVHDALLQRNGILKWWHEEKQVARISRHSGLTEDALAVLVAGDVEVLEHTAREEMTEQGPIEVHDVKIRRVLTERQNRVASVPRERFLIHSDAVTLQDSLLTGEKSTLRRSDLTAMGYDRDLIDKLAVAKDDDDESDERRDFAAQNMTEAQRANEPIDYYDLFIRIDLDGDGIAELRHMTFAGGLAEKNLLTDDECDEVQFCDIAVMRMPHQWEGISLFDDLHDIQQAKTVLLRQTLDNIYWQNNLQPVMQDGAIKNPDAVFNPEFGKPIRVSQGVDARAAIAYNPVPFVAEASFGMLDYLDREAEDRTGVSDASSGLAPDALQNMTAKASAMIEQGSIGQTELMVRTVADGLKVLFKGLLRLVIQHQDAPRTIRLRDQWVQVDPRQWNADMDCSVNTGLGAGTRERDMQVMMQVLGLQEKLIAGFGPDNPFVKPENLYATMAKLVESAGLKTPGLYFTEPDAEEIAAKMAAAQQAPDPEQMKLEAQMQVEQAKLDAQLQIEQARQQSARDKEMAQMEADLAVKQAEIEAGSVRQREELASKAAIKQMEISWDREKFYADLKQRAQDQVQRAQADAIRPHLVGDAPERIAK